MKSLKQIFINIFSSIMLCLLIWLGYNYEHGLLPEWLTICINTFFIIDITIIGAIILLAFYCAKQFDKNKEKIYKEEIKKYGSSLLENDPNYML